MLGSRFYDFGLDGLEIALQGFSKAFLSKFGKQSHRSVMSGDVGGMWMSSTLHHMTHQLTQS